MKATSSSTAPLASQRSPHPSPSVATVLALGGWHLAWRSSVSDKGSGLLLCWISASYCACRTRTRSTKSVPSCWHRHTLFTPTGTLREQITNDTVKSLRSENQTTVIISIKRFFGMINKPGCRCQDFNSPAYTKWDTLQVKVILIKALWLRPLLMMSKDVCVVM